MHIHVISSYFTTLFSRDAEVKRDEHVKDAGKLVTRATKYKDEAKREQKKMEEKWKQGLEEEAVKTAPLEQVRF